MSKQTQQNEDVLQINGHMKITIDIDAKGKAKYSVHGNDMVTMDGKPITNEEAEAILNKAAKGGEE